MNKNKSKLTIVMSLMICLTVVVGMLGSGLLFADGGHWADKQMNEWASKGLLMGDENGNFNPDNKVSRAEFIAFINRMMGYTAATGKANQFKDVPSDAWYYKPVDVALEAGYISGIDSELMDPTGNITREQAMAMLVRVSNLQASQDGYKKASDYAEVSDWAIAPVSTCIDQGFIVGYKGMVMPLKDMTRAEAIVMLNRKMVDERVFALPGEYDLASQTVNNVIVTGNQDINLKNLTVEKNLEVRNEAGNTVNLDSVNVKTDLVVEKDCSNATIIAKGTSKFANTILKSCVTVKNETNDKTAFAKVVITEDLAACKKVTLEGDFGVVENNCKDLTLTINGNIAELVLNENATVEGKGKVEKVTKASDEVTLDDNSTPLGSLSGGSDDDDDDDEDDDSSTPSTPTPSKDSSINSILTAITSGDLKLNVKYNGKERNLNLAAGQTIEQALVSDESVTLINKAKDKVNNKLLNTHKVLGPDGNPLLSEANLTGQGMLALIMPTVNASDYFDWDADNNIQVKDMTKALVEEAVATFKSADATQIETALNANAIGPATFNGKPITLELMFGDKTINDSAYGTFVKSALANKDYLAKASNDILETVEYKISFVAKAGDDKVFSSEVVFSPMVVDLKIEATVTGNVKTLRDKLISTGLTNDALLTNGKATFTLAELDAKKAEFTAEELAELANILK